MCYENYNCGWSGVVVSALASINEINQRRARLVLRRVTVSGFNSRCRTFISVYVTNQPPKANSAFHPSGVGKWVPALAGKAKAGMFHSVSGWTRGVQVKLWDPLRTRAIPKRLRGVFTTRRYTNTRLLLPTLPLPLQLIKTTRIWREAFSLSSRISDINTVKLSTLGYSDCWFVWWMMNKNRRQKSDVYFATYIVIRRSIKLCPRKAQIHKFQLSGSKVSVKYGHF